MTGQVGLGYDRTGWAGVLLDKLGDGVTVGSWTSNLTNAGSILSEFD